MELGKARVVRSLPEESRKRITIMRAFAVLSIVSAHCTSSPADASYITRFASFFMQGFGQLGVAVFFFISGILYAKDSKSFKCFWKGKVTSLFIPWFVCATLVYLYVALRKGTFSVTGALLSVLGYSSSFWYLASLVLFFLLTYWFKNNKKAILIIVGISLAYRIPLGLGLLPHNNFTYYINPLNWFWVFGAGMLMTNCDIIVKPIEIDNKKSIAFSVIFLLAVVAWLTVNAMNCTVYGYTNLLYVPLSLTFLIAVLFLSRCLCNKKNVIVKTIHGLGVKSFSVYLLHELGVAGLVSAVFQRIDSPWFVVVRPAVVILLTWVVLEFLGFIFRRIGLYTAFAMCTGLRKGKKCYESTVDRCQL